MANFTREVSESAMFVISRFKSFKMDIEMDEWTPKDLTSIFSLASTRKNNLINTEFLECNRN